MMLNPKRTPTCSHTRALFSTRAPRHGLAGLALGAAAAPVLAAHPPAVVMRDGQPVTETVHVCWPIDESGALTGTRVTMPVSEGVLEYRERAGRSLLAADNRVDFVFVGDGYTAAELGQYTADVTNVVSNFFAYEPFIRYESYFRITQVDVVSAQSGVDNDPTQGISRNTALDMSYWCGGTERLLCVNTTKAYNAANNAGVPDIDQIIALANSSKYGGAGYTGSDLATAAGHNSSAVQIAIHEIGHSLGELADEYDYGGPETYSGGEPSTANSSTYTGAEQAAQQRKWYRWLGASADPRFDDPIGSYEGCDYSVFGIYRPSNNSMMRNLFRQFNQPSAESIIRNIYLECSPIDDAASNATTLSEGDTVWVVPMRPAGTPLQVRWTIDGADEPSLDGVETVDLGSLGLGTGTHTVKVTVTDTTDMVRNETQRANRMTASRSWSVQVACQSVAEMNGDGVVDNGDIAVFVSLFLAGNASADLNGDGFLDNADIGTFVEAFLNGC